MRDPVEQLAELSATENRVAMATLLAARGGSPRPIGAKLFVGEGGRLLGSVSIGGCVDARVVEHGERLLREDRWATVTVSVDDVEAVELGLNCGAEFDMLIEPIDLRAEDERLAAYAEAQRLSREGREAFVITQLEGPRPRRTVTHEGVQSVPGRIFVERFAPADILVIVGASDVAAALARLARMVGMRIVVIDGRDRYATQARFPGVEELHVGIPSELVQPWLGAGTFLVLLTHDYKYELPVLREALQRDVRFVGMLAGRKRADGIRSMLRDNGLSQEQVSRLHAPVGLDIGGREPEEIAVSILAQLIAVREGKPLAHR